MMHVLLKKDPSQPSPQGGGLEPVAPLSHNVGGAVPQVFSPLAGGDGRQARGGSMMTVLSRKGPSQPSSQGGGLEPVAPLSHNLGGAVPLVFSPLVGEMAGRPEGDFRRVLRP